MSFETDLNVLVLSDNKKKASALSHLVISSWTALVEAHVNRQTYALASSLFSSFSVVYKGPAKSPPVRVKGGSSETHSSGNSGDSGSENGVPSTFLHVTHHAAFCTINFHVTPLFAM